MATHSDMATNMKTNGKVVMYTAQFLHVSLVLLTMAMTQIASEQVILLIELSARVILDDSVLASSLTRVTCSSSNYCGLIVGGDFGNNFLQVIQYYH